MLEGNQAGARWTARRFPVRIGRNADADVVLNDPGVWEDHVELDYEPEAGFVTKPLSAGTTLVNDRPLGETPFRHGSTVRVGAALLQFWLTPAPQRPFAVLEGALWTGVLLLCAAEVFLILHLSR